MKEHNLSYHGKEVILFTTDPCYGNIIYEGFRGFSPSRAPLRVPLRVWAIQGFGSGGLCWSCWQVVP